LWLNLPVLALDSLFFHHYLILRECVLHRSASWRWEVSSGCTQVQTSDMHRLYHLSWCRWYVKGKQLLCRETKVWCNLALWSLFVVLFIIALTYTFFFSFLTRSNFLGTKFTIYDSQPPHSGARIMKSRSTRLVNLKQVSPKVPTGNYPVAHISYELNVLGSR